MSDERKPVICRYCGEQMRLASAIDGDTARDYYACYQCLCGHRTPYGKGKTRPKAIEASYAAATQRPPNRPLTLKEAHDYGLLHPDEPIYIEYSMPLEDNSEYACASMMRSFKPDGQGSATYGTSWRCWLRKPTPADIDAARKEADCK